MTAEAPKQTSSASFARLALWTFVLFLGLFEGPAEIACAVVLVALATSGAFRGYELGWVEAGIGIWGLAGLYGLINTDASIPSEDKFRPLLALAFFVGSVGLRKADSRTLRIAAWVFLGACALNIGYGFLQIALGTLPTDTLIMGQRTTRQMFVPGHPNIRAMSGLFYNRLKLAHVCIATLGVIGAMSFTRPWDRRDPKLLLPIGGAAIVLFTIIMTYARMALVASFVAAGAMLVLTVRKKSVRIAAVAIGVAVPLILFSFSSSRERILTSAGDLSVRIQIMKGALEVFFSHPWLGVGHGVYPTAARALAAGHWGPHFIDAHNFFLHVLAETGLIGGLGFGTAVFICIYQLLVKIRADRSAEMSCIAWGTAFVLAGYLSLGLVHFFLHHGSVALIFWTALGVAASAKPRAPEPSGVD